MGTGERRTTAISKGGASLQAQQRQSNFETTLQFLSSQQNGVKGTISAEAETIDLGRLAWTISELHYPRNN
jgi:hypothetical protein